MYIINLLLSPLYRIAAAVVAILAFLAVIYGKGRSDASANAKLKNYKETQDAIEKATSARTRVNNAPAERLRDDDGFRRD